MKRLKEVKGIRKGMRKRKEERRKKKEEAKKRLLKEEIDMATLRETEYLICV